MKNLAYIISFSSFCFAAFVGSVDISAGGPIWSNVDAQRTCPDVCASQNMDWKSVWSTTEKNKLSVCGCVPKPCNSNSDCPNAAGALDPGIACCQNQCLQKKKDWAGFWYCPDVCVGSFWGKAGTCN